MQILIIKQRADVRFQTELINVALELRVPVTMADIFLRFDVADLPAFFRCVWRVYAMFSRTSLGSLNHERRVLLVSDYDVYVWYCCEMDEGGCYIRYGEVIR